MSEYILSCCSTADRSAEFFKEHDIPYVCFHFIADGKEYPDDLGKTIAFSEFYQWMRAGTAPTTSQVNTDEFIAFFEPFLKDGKDILHVCLSSGLSGVWNAANIAKTMLAEKYPDRKILLLDSLGASAGYGLLMEYLAEKREAGGTIDEVYEWAQENKLRLHHWFFSTDLTSYKRGGRISATAAVVGTVLGICPLLNMDTQGHLIPREKIRGKRNVIPRIVKMMELHAQDGLAYAGKCAISHSDCLEDVNAVVDLLEQTFPQLKGKISVNSVGTVIGSHTGPGTVALFFMGDERVD